MICARIGKLSWLLFIFLTCIISPILSGTVNKKSRRIRRSGPNVCGGQECCVGWQPASVDQGLCIQPICNFNCGTGICVRPNTCLCENGQYNPTCTQTDSDCKVRCLNGGTCKDDKCQCPQGFEGKICENPVCNLACLNGGQCIAPNTCACLYGFAGPQCQSDFRSGPCYKEVKNLKCQGQVSTLICTRELCCATVGKAWGIPCQRCPTKPEPCAIGYLPDYESRECLDIDECKAVPGVCGDNGKCINTVGSYRCERCEVGFKYDEQAAKCVDIDECADRQTNRCLNGRCLNTAGSFRCVCESGFVLSSDGSICKKVPTLPPSKRRCYKQILRNTCFEPISDNVTRAECCCSSNIAGAGWSEACQRCPVKNTGEYTALCQIFECLEEGEECHNGVCKLTDSGLRCVCDVGYTYDPSSKICVDIDECEDGGLICENAYCVNTPGNFMCECKDGYQPGSNRVTCVPISGIPGTTPTMPTTSVTSVGECSRVGQQCENGVCAIVDGMLRCSCNAGFRYVQNKCVDKNECQDFSAICQNGLCVNEIGGYRCECAEGYRPTSDQKSCVDRNECTDSATCANGQCFNTVGAWRCTCNKGFALSSDEKSCIDIDECRSIDDVCMNGICVNTAGDYLCRCNTGYSLSTDKHMCLDTMESRCYARYSNNVCSQTLFRPLTISQCCCGTDNTAEKLRAWGNPCMACPAPKSADFKKVCVHGQGKDSGGKDIDECSNNVGAQTDLCLNARCRNTNGDYICDCNTGYRNTDSSRKECEEVNECRENPSLCHRGRCVNTKGSYRCVCPKGFVFDSRTKGCEDENECEKENQCIDGTCINNIGSFKCQCPEGLTLHESGRLCEDLRKGKCWRKNDGVCEDNVNGDVTREVCCQTLGKAWGSPCQACSTTDAKCSRGYAYRNFTCADINECEAFPGICRNGRCLNTQGSYRCECSEGLTLDESRSVCLDEREAVCYQTVTSDECTKPVRGLYKKDICCCSVGAAWGRPCEECPLKDTREFDELCRDGQTGRKIVVDECTIFPGICANGECIDTPGSFICECRSGYALDETGKNCTDINECEITPHLCGNGTCINVGGGFRCDCQEGFKNAPMMMEICIDVDECDDLSNPCQGGTCVNTIGSFKCDCPPGKRMDPSGLMCQDINECAEDSFICPYGTCQNFMGGYQCACFRGFESSDDMKECIDIDECATENGRCEALCANTIGTYRCDCPSGLRLQNDGRSCADINECVETPEICGVGNKCQNVYAGHECVCSDAYALSEDRKSCIDIDECVSDPELCKNGECQNLLGSFQCICSEGFVLDEQSSVCIDVNECASGESRCDSNAFCMNSLGSYSCTCNEGFEEDDDGSCQDINECVSDGDRCNENSVCINTEGSYACECAEGYSLASDNTCKDVDECTELSSACSDNGKCLNTPGAYECECDFGYLQTTDGKDCEDLNECEAMEEFCHHGRCKNIPGSFACICDKGFQLNRFNNNCTDTNECEESGMCLNGRCVNEMGKYRCECDSDFEPNPDNTACIDTRTGPCHLTKGPGPKSCSNIVTDDVLRSKCCCSVGAAWNECEECPKNGTDDYKHLCPSGDGFVVDPLTTELIDINECLFVSICLNGTCVNTLGSFRCTCSRGFEYKQSIGTCVDVNECEEDEFTCGITGMCTNTIGHYYCECPPGEVLIGNQCIDQRLHACFKDEQDRGNIEGSTPGSSCNESLSYRPISRTECCCSAGTAYGPPDMCKLCPIRYSEEFYSLCGVVEPTRPSGPNGTPHPPGGTKVVDVDECSFMIEPCGMGVCRNTYGSYECDCFKGYAVLGNDKKCKDVNECLVNPCRGGQCKNTFGSFMCTCPTGYVVDETGLQCVDHNECHLNNTCTNGVCINIVGNYRCLCDRGYQPSRAGKSCSDIDECSNGNAKCKKGICINTPGSYSCQCDEGYREDSAHNCRDIDECVELQNQVCRNGICVNNAGGFSCTCTIGYTLDDSGRNCRDLDECNEIDGYCSNGTCTNSIGGSKCDCTKGFTIHPSGDKCVDIDECEEDPNLCQMEGRCKNKPGGFECICPEGYKLANYGKMCVDMRLGYCFDNLDTQGCSKPRLKLSTKMTCCCTRGAGWGEPCDLCPAEQTNSFTLLCPKGPGYSVKNDTVDDVNECEYSNLCKNGRCINNDGSYRCKCFLGYVLDDTGRNCRDVDECLTEGICGNGTCTNTPGSYTCDCAVGFRRGRLSPSCRDINECSETRNLCAFRCVNVPGTYRCICPRGYKLHVDGRHCTDVNECTTGIHNCAYVCKNFVGGFKCICPAGFRRAGRKCIDINECREDSSRCRNGVCRNTAGGYICDCNDGYKRTADGKSCEDLSRGLCFSQVDNGICKGSTKMMMLVTKTDCCCTAGIAWGGQCISCPRKETTAYRRLCISYKEIDECKMIPDLCPNGKCINTRDSYRCMCHHGFRLSRTGKKCDDVDECARTPKPCPNECENTPGSYKCKCPVGYQQGSTPGSCQDVDECQNGSNNCPQGCVNTIGSYSCTCRQGYRWTGTTCADINECQARQNICGFGTCVNQPGSYTCLCQRGYKYNAQTKTCVDLNECNIRRCQGTCVNRNGGYRCGCPSGFVMRPYWNRCVDVNECTTGANKCGRTKCTNIRGGYRCYCPQGFQLDRIRMICKDTNECTRNPCSTAGCYNIGGGFQCSCPTGFYPIGGGHCISRYGQTCYNCASGQRRQRPQSIVTQNKYKFGETPKSQPKATPSRYNSRLAPQSQYRSSSEYYQNQSRQQKNSNPDPYRYTYSYGSSSGQRKRRTSHFVHKLKMSVPRNLTARDNLLVLTPVLKTLLEHFHYEILKGNRSLFEVYVKDGVSILHAKQSLEVGLHRVYLKGKLDNTKMKLAFEGENHIEFTASGDEKKPKVKSVESEIELNAVPGVSAAKKFHLELYITVV